jgi:monothiol glutaredoxin
MHLSTQDTITLIEQQLAENTLILYMKGTPEQPRCGFSARVVQVLNVCQLNFAAVDVLTHPEIRQALPLYSQWPTFPQLYYRGELIGGCDIVEELYKKGELKEKLT